MKHEGFADKTLERMPNLTSETFTTVTTGEIHQEIPVRIAKVSIADRLKESF